MYMQNNWEMFPLVSSNVFEIVDRYHQGNDVDLVKHALLISGYFFHRWGFQF